MWSEACFSEWEQEILLYLDNELSPESRTRLEGHLNRCVHCRRFVEDQRRFESELGFDLRLKQRSHTLPNDFTEKIIENLPGMLPLHRWQRLRLFWEQTWCPQHWWQFTVRHAAVVISLFLLIVIGGGSFFLNIPEEDYDVRVIQVAKKAFLIPLGEPITNTAKEKVMYRLPDNSHIIVQPDSSFRIDAYQHQGDDRALSMSRGEIWCDVLPSDEGFSVTTPHAIVRVMGTRFSVKVTSAETKVEVVEGQVLIEKREGGLPKTAAVRSGHHSSVPRRGRIRVPARLDQERIKEIQVAFVRIDEFRTLYEELHAPKDKSTSEAADLFNQNPGNEPGRHKDPPLFLVP